MNSFNIPVIALTTILFSFAAQAQTTKTTNVDAKKAIQEQAKSPYGGIPSPYGAGGMSGSNPQEKAQMTESMSAMAIDRKQYMEQMMMVFDSMDRNGDGKLGADEMALAPPTDQGEGLMRRVDNQEKATNTAAPKSNTKSLAPLSGQNSAPVGIPGLGGR
jgi:hypothetical protein